VTTTIRRPVALAAAALMLFAILVAATPSEAGHPGDNGPLFYSDGTDVYTVNSNGSGQVTTPVGKLTRLRRVPRRHQSGRRRHR